MTLRIRLAYIHYLNKILRFIKIGCCILRKRAAKLIAEKLVCKGNDKYCDREYGSCGNGGFSFILPFHLLHPLPRAQAAAPLK